MTCPDCRGTKVYIGLGWLPAEPCRTCAVSPGPDAETTDDFALPEGLEWRMGAGALLHAFYIQQPSTRNGLALYLLNDAPIGGLLDRPDAEELIALLRRKNGIA